MLPKPPTCAPCVLADRGRGYAPADGPPSARLVLVGEALGDEEVRVGRPFYGAAGGMLSRLLRYAGIERDDIRIDNAVRCSPPGNWLDGAPWESAALSTCSQYLSQTLAQPEIQVVVTLGAVALRTVLNLPKKGTRVQDWHGCPTRDPLDRFWVVPTYHPSFLQRGASNLIGVATWDLERALQIVNAGGEWTPDLPTLVCDPSIEWFAAWVDRYLAALAQDPEGIYLACDIETPDKAGGQDEGELGADDRSTTILRVNVACDLAEGVTVPFQGPYIPLLRRVLTAGGIVQLWHADYDEPRLAAADIRIDRQHLWDLMWAWHVLQSDLPRGLGFAAPFYGSGVAWKHWAKSDPVRYAAMDGVQTLRIGHGLVRDLVQSRMWSIFERHICDRDRLSLLPAKEEGILIDRGELTRFRLSLEATSRRLLAEMQPCVPEAIRPLTPKGGLKSPPTPDAQHTKVREVVRQHARPLIPGERPPDDLKAELFASSVVVTRTITKLIQVCRLCGAEEIAKTHTCQQPLPGTKMRPKGQVELQERDVTRYFWQEPFNPDSAPQVLAYIKHRKHAPGKAKKTRKDTTDKKTLDRLARTTHDPLYALLLQNRAVQKVRGTYVVGTERRLGADNRLHPTPTHRPSTLRTSYVNPNIQNVVADKGSTDATRPSLAAGFRRCVIAAPSCRFLAVDYAGIETIQVGWFSGSAEHVRLGRLGLHAYFASHVLNRPASLIWADADLAGYLKEIKRADPLVYDRCKRTVHGIGYGLTIYGMHEQFPETFPSLKVATQYRDLFMQLLPRVGPWQQQVRERAHRQKYLGGPGDHPYSYRHWFHSVLTYRPITESQRLYRMKRGGSCTQMHGRWFAVDLGEDAKRATSFFPQSTAAGNLAEAELELFDPDLPSYIGDAYYGRTPFRAPIHDELFLEVPVRQWDRVLEAVCRAMLRPIEEQPLPAEWGMGSHLTIPISVKVGKIGGNWAELEEIPVPTAAEVGLDPLGYSPWAIGALAQEGRVYAGIEEEDEEDVADLGTVVSLVERAGVEGEAGRKGAVGLSP